jgi:hypothetical protein
MFLIVLRQIIYKNNVLFTYMRFFQVLFLLFKILSGKLFTKVIQTPIFDSNKICNSHHIVLLKETPFIDNTYEYSELYAVDFSPNDDITDPTIALKIFLGKKVNGKIRMVYFDHIDYYSLITNPLDKNLLCSIDRIEELDPIIYHKIRCWNPSFQLYKQNCQHFGRYLCS